MLLYYFNSSTLKLQGAKKVYGFQKTQPR